jgi:hypothetical protein
MPGGFPASFDICNGTLISSATLPGGSSIAVGTQVTASSTANTKGSWTQVIASTPSDTSWITIMLGNNSVSSKSGAIDIGIGATGSEVVVVQNLIIIESYEPCSISLPLQIPTGAKVSIRAQAAGGADIFSVTMILFDGSFVQSEGIAGVDAIGFNTATTLGMVCTPGNNTYSSYAQLILSTARDYAGIFALYDFQNQNVTVSTQQGCFVDIAIGAGGSEVNLVQSIPLIYYGTHYAGIDPPCPLQFTPINIPVGTRLAFRAKAPAAQTQTFGLTLYGLYQ